MVYRFGRLKDLAKADRKVLVNAGLKELDRRYGDIDTFLTKGLGLSTKTIATLRDRLRDG